MDFSQEIYDAIPHRPPFLWVDSIISSDAKSLATEKYIDPELDFFKGHYPGNPIMPGVLLCEAVFQTGALFMSRMLQTPESSVSEKTKTPVLTRISKAKFKREVKPGEMIRIQVTLNENIGNVWFFKGKVMVEDKVAVKVEFGCALVDEK